MVYSDRTYVEMGPGPGPRPGLIQCQIKDLSKMQCEGLT